MNEAERWVQFGQYLVEQRQRLGLKRREAAKRAKVPEATWRDLEAGYRNSYSGGVRVLPHPTQEILEAVAQALELTPDELLQHMPRPARRRTTAARTAPADDAAPLARKIARLSERDRRLVEQIVDLMIDDE